MLERRGAAARGLPLRRAGDRRAARRALRPRAQLLELAHERRLHGAARHPRRARLVDDARRPARDPPSLVAALRDHVPEPPRRDLQPRRLLLRDDGRRSPTPGGLRYDGGARGARRGRAALLADARRSAASERIVALQLGASRAIRQWPEASFVAARPGRSSAAGLRAWSWSAAAVIARSATASPARDRRRRPSTPAARPASASSARVLARAAALVTGDTGPMHMAVAVGTPVVGLFFGPASPFDTGPVRAPTTSCCTPARRARRAITTSPVSSRSAATSSRPRWSPRRSRARAGRRLARRSRRSRAALGAGAALSHRLRRATAASLAPPLGAPSRRGARTRCATPIARLFLHVLEGVAAAGAACRPRSTSRRSRRWRELARDGLAQAGALAELARAKQPRIAEIERLGRELEVLDRALKEHGGTHPDTNVLDADVHVRQGEPRRRRRRDARGRDDARSTAISPAAADCMTALLGGAPAKEQENDARLHQ